MLDLMGQPLRCLRSTNLTVLEWLSGLSASHVSFVRTVDAGFL